MTAPIRFLIAERDGATDLEIDEMFEDFSILIGGGDDPEDALAEVFGLEPDYLLSDDEAAAAMDRGFSMRPHSPRRLRDTEGDLE